MNLQDLVRERVIGNIKTGTKGENGLPQKLAYFHVEEDKATSSEMVDIFKQLYPNKPTKLKIRFTTEEPFQFKFRRYVKGKVVCIGNGTKAITIGKNEKGQNAQIEIDCNENCDQRACGRCKLVGSLKFVLEGINAGGVWKINTSGGFSLSNIATEIVKLKRAGLSIKGVPFELTLTPQESLAYGTYYSLDLKRTDIKPQLTIGETELLEIPEKATVQEVKELPENTSKIVQETKKESKTKSKKSVESKDENKVVEIQAVKQEEKKEEKKEDVSNYLVVKDISTIQINNTNFNKIIFQDYNNQDVEYVLHPKAKQDLITKYTGGTLIKLINSKLELNHNILCEYEIVKAIDKEGNVIEFNNGELKKAV